MTTNRPRPPLFRHSGRSPTDKKGSGGSAPYALRALALARNRLGDASAASCARHLWSHPSLTALDLGGNQIGVEGAHALSVMCRSTTRRARGSPIVATSSPKRGGGTARGLANSTNSAPRASVSGGGSLGGRGLRTVALGWNSVRSGASPIVAIGIGGAGTLRTLDLRRAPSRGARLCHRPPSNVMQRVRMPPASRRVTRRRDE